MGFPWCQCAVDFSQHQALREGQPINLTPTLAATYYLIRMPSLRHGGIGRCAILTLSSGGAPIANFQTVSRDLFGTRRGNARDPHALASA